ncbi:MAG: tetratricopeptide repeat protein, partial [Planctomycetaceae bacterium]|nr:tetratricopeptide repeat protein [Planctomycetaceae bacterium]
QAESAEAGIQQAKALIRQRKFPDAIRMLKKLHEADPRDGDIHELLGTAHFIAGQLEEARDVLERLTREDSSRVKAWVNLGAVLNRLGEFRKANDALRRALQKDRRCAEAYYNMGIAQKGAGLNTMAINAYKEAVKLAPTMVDAHMNLGKLYAEMNNSRQATMCFQAVLDIEPEHSKAKLLLERTQSTSKAAKKAASPFGRLVDIDKLNQSDTSTVPRQLDAATRNTEREYVREVSRQIRRDARDLIPLLDEQLHTNLHQLQMIALHSDDRTADPAIYDHFVETISGIQELHDRMSTDLGRLQYLVDKGVPPEKDQQPD